MLPSKILKPQYIPNHLEHWLSPQQVQHLNECLKKDITYNLAQADQYIQLDEPELPNFLLHFDEEEDPMPCFAMTNPYEALLVNDPDRLCV